MNKARWVSATAGAAMVAATLVLPAAGVAYASGNGNVTGNGNVSVLSGNTLDAPISLPVNLCGVSLGIVGFANSGCEGGAQQQRFHRSVRRQRRQRRQQWQRQRGWQRQRRPWFRQHDHGADQRAGQRLRRLGAPRRGFANSDCKGGAEVNLPSCQGQALRPAGLPRPGLHPCRPVCHGQDCTPPGCHGQDCTPPGCHGQDCTPSRLPRQPLHPAGLHRQPLHAARQRGEPERHQPARCQPRVAWT